MRRATVTEAKNKLSALLAQVRAGETIEITDRGRPVALLGPLPPEGTLDRLRALGEVERATAGFDDLPEPLPLRPGAEAPSKVLERLRRDER
jgi:prevent-host-death family protein